MVRKNFIAGNWKMNTDITQAVALAKQIAEKVGDNTDVDVAICPPYISLYAVGQAIQGSSVKLGAQDVFWEEKGAFTGKISCAMLKSVGVDYVIIGHSERRSYFGETDQNVNIKAKAALASGLKPIICVGESLDERKDDRMEKVVGTQIRGAFDGITGAEALNCTIAYEPVWAIGTGETATPEQADAAHAFIRNVLKRIYTEETSEVIRIQYGGSMKPGNAKDLLGRPNVDGGLIGGAALDAENFSGIVFPK